MEEADDTQSGKVGKVVPAIRGEHWPMLLSGGFFFCVLLGMMMLRPAREAMGVERGMAQLQILFVATALVSLIVTVMFGGLVSMMDRRRFIPIGFRVVMGCLVVFAVARLVMGEELRQHSGAVFYVWFSVFNMFVTSVFWAFMADIWRVDQAKRLYPVIGIGGTLGAIAGSSVPWMIGERMGEHGPAVLMALSIVMFELGVRLMLALDRVTSRSGSGERLGRAPHAVGGNMYDGLVLVARSPYLIGLAIYVAMAAVSSTFIYFSGVELVLDKKDELAGRLPLFAQLDTYKQVATLACQLFVTSRLIRAVGIGGALCVVPVVTVAGFAAVWYAGHGSDAAVWGTFAIFQAVHSASRYAFMRPARETLFSVLTQGEKYKAKTVVDMFVYRAGDVAGAGLTAAGVASIGWMLTAVTPLAGVWVVLAIYLGIAQKRKAMSPVENQHAGPGGIDDSEQGVS